MASSAATTTVLETSRVYKTTFGEDFVPPQYTIKDILDAIPKRCFERSFARSFAHVLRDLSYTAGLVYCASHIHLVSSAPLRFLCWAVYGILQGMVGTGIWVLAHECGHGAFSTSRRANDTVGWILHSSLFVPYHSWRLTHSKHHKATGHLTRDTVFVPREQETYLISRNLSELTEEAPIASLYWLVVQQLFGWPTHLLTNVTGQKYPGVAKWKVNHYWPGAPMFDARDYRDIVISDIGIAIASAVAYFAIKKFGLANFILYYFIPYLFVNHWLVCITYLQHTDPNLPHYNAEEWNFARGAAATVDRGFFGPVGRHFFHEIIETHVAHHYSSRIPFYHAEEATQAIRKVMGSHYHVDRTNVLVALWRTVRTCQFIEGDGVKMYRNGNGIGIKPQKLVIDSKKTQ
ncbi:fatty acid desaturase-domain-containing protein [Kockiozyma suomiensis]|uniref:fatty acid desaturase-domain-containing protein n=1 Tax=Kockiozyma suomiensis TaxID=1337062 RepID=UPI0033441F17